MKKEDAIEKLTVQLKTIDKFTSLDLSDNFYQWQMDTKMVIQVIFADNYEYLKCFKEINSTERYGPKYNAFAQTIGISKDGLEKYRAILQSMIKTIQDYWEENNTNQPTISDLNKIELLCNRFDLVARQIQIRYGKGKRTTIEINDEYDVQDLFHALLTLYFDDIRDEEWTPSYAGRASRVDFLLKEEQIVIELKKTRENLTGKEVGEQLIIDITRYKSHPDCKTLICFVYDPERRIKNPRGLENDLSKTTDGMIVQVFIRPT